MNEKDLKKKYLVFTMVVGAIFLLGLLFIVRMKFLSEELIVKGISVYAGQSLKIQLPAGFSIVKKASLQPDGFYAVIEIAPEDNPLFMSVLATNSEWTRLPLPPEMILPEYPVIKDIPIPAGATNGYYFCESWGLLSLTNCGFPCYLFALYDSDLKRIYILDHKPNKEKK